MPTETNMENDIVVVIVPQAHVQTLSSRTCIQLLTCGFTHRLSYVNLAVLIFIVPFHLGCADPLVNQLV